MEGDGINHRETRGGSASVAHFPCFSVLFKPRGPLSKTIPFLEAEIRLFLTQGSQFNLGQLA